MTPHNGGKNSKNITVWVLDVLGNEWPVPTTTDDDVIGVLMLMLSSPCTTLAHSPILFGCNVRKTRVSCIVLCLRVRTHTHTHTSKLEFWCVRTYAMCMCSSIAFNTLSLSHTHSVSLSHSHTLSLTRTHTDKLVTQDFEIR
jgi:hypothetical protein